MNRHEEAFIRAFVEPSRQERFLGFVASEKKRGKFTDELNHLHSRFLIQKYLKQLKGAASLPPAVYDSLRRSGAPDVCWAIGGRFDGQEIGLLKGLTDSGDGFILSCLPGTLAYLKSEDEELILQR